MLARTVLDNETYCEWLYQVRDCVDSQWFLTIHFSNVVIGTVADFNLLILLFFLVFKLKLPLYRDGTFGGITCNFIFIILCTSLNLLYSLLIYLDVGNGSAKIFMVLYTCFSFMFFSMSVYLEKAMGILSSTALSVAAPNMFGLRFILVLFNLSYSCLTFFGFSYLSILIDESSPSADYAFEIVYGLLFAHAIIMSMILCWAGFGFFFVNMDEIGTGNEKPYSYLKNEVRKIQLTIIFALSGLLPFIALAGIIAFCRDLFVRVMFSKIISVFTLLAMSSLVLLFTFVYSFFAVAGYRNRRAKKELLALNGVQMDFSKEFSNDFVNQDV